MLTTHAFNAMLKTLEEPPAHLKFILATTDPQKIPVTVLSRCIQYNLKQMAPESVVEHLQLLLAEEAVEYETAALQLIARGAAGSMRDALSLTDQAIAFSGNRITVEAMQDMLGTIDQSYLVNLLRALLAGDASKVVTLADAIAERGFSYEGALADLSIVLSRIAMEQRLPGTLDSDDPLFEDMMSVAQSAHQDILQLFYSIAVHGRKELALAPDEYSGFVMICLRMLALVNAPTIQQELDQRPQATSTSPASSVSATSAPNEEPKKKVSSVKNSGEEASASTLEQEPEPVELATSHDLSEQSEALVAESVTVQEPVAPVEPVVATEVVEAATSEPAAMSDADWDRIYGSNLSDYDGDIVDEPLPDNRLEMSWEPNAVEHKNKISLSGLNQERWIELTKSLELSGLAGELLLNSQWLATEGNTIHLKIFLRNVDELAIKSTLTTALTEYFSQVVKLDFEVGETGDATARAQLIKQQKERQRQAEELVANDPYIKSLEESFGAIVIDGSVQVLSNQ